MYAIAQQMEQRGEQGESQVNGDGDGDDAPTGQSKVDQVVSHGPQCSGEPLCSSPKVSATIDLDGVKSIRVHPRKIDICCTVPEKRVLDNGSLTVEKHSSIPMCNISLVHEQKTLCGGLLDTPIPPVEWCSKSHITDL